MVRTASSRARACLWVALAAALVAGCGSSAGSGAATTPGSVAARASETTGPLSEPTSPRSAPPVPPLPDASPGPFAVGHTTMFIPADAAGPELMIDVWYPSDGTPGTKARYELLAGVGIDGLLAQVDVPPARGSFPLVVYSHGSGGFRFVATYFTEILASHGYVVAAVDHPGDIVLDAFIRSTSGGELEHSARRTAQDR